MSVLLAGLSLDARADVVITLNPKDTLGNAVTGPVDSGTLIDVDILLSVTGADDPLPDVRTIIFDLSGSSDTIVPVQFTWLLDPTAYSFQFATFPVPQITTLLSNSNPGLLELNAGPQRVATVSVTVNGDGTLDVVTPATNGGLVSADFLMPVDFTSQAGNLSGGVLNLTAVGGMGPGPIDPDSDGDGVPDSTDAFPNDSAESIDTDGDGVGDNGDAFPMDAAESIDSDADGVGDNADVFPNDPNETVDTDSDGIGDNEDTDDDNDGVPDTEDAFPLNANESVDADADGVGDNADVFPTDPTESVDTDNDGTGNNADMDDDGDGVVDTQDAFPLDSTETTDNNGNGVGDNAEAGGSNANTGPLAGGGGLCGSGMLGSMAFVSVWLLMWTPGRKRRRGSALS